MALPDFVLSVFGIGIVQVAVMWWFAVGLLILCFIAAIAVYAATAIGNFGIDDD